MEPENGMVCGNKTDEDGGFMGLSTYASAEDLTVEVTGQVWRLPAGSVLRDLGVAADGANYGGPAPSSHHTIYPTKTMTLAEFQSRILALPWEHVGHTRDYQ